MALDPLTIGLGLSAAGNLLGGIFGSRSARSNAANARAAAEANAAVYQQMGNYNADVYMAAGEANAGNIMAAARWNANVAQKFADYNADIIKMVADYNAQLNELDARYVLESAEIDIDQTDKQIRQLLGKNRTYYAGAGVQVNSGSPVDAAVDVRTQGDIDLAIIRRSADIEAAKFQDAAAMTRWQGNTDATLTSYQGTIQGYQALAQGTLQAATVLTDSRNQAAMSRYQGNVNAIMTQYNGASQAAMYNSQANQAMWSGVLNAGMAATQAYLGYKWMNPTTTATSNVGPLRNASSIGYKTGLTGPYAGAYYKPPSYSPIVSSSGAINMLESKYGLLGN